MYLHTYIYAQVQTHGLSLQHLVGPKKGLIMTTVDNPIIPGLWNLLTGSGTPFSVGHPLTLKQFQCTHVTSSNMVSDSQVSKEQSRRHQCTPGLFCINKCHINILGALRMLIMMDPNWQRRSVVSFVIGQCVMFSLYCLDQANQIPNPLHNYPAHLHCRGINTWSITVRSFSEMLI